MRIWSSILVDKHSLQNDHVCICTCLLLSISMLWHRLLIFEWKRDKLSSSAECRIRTQGLKHQIASRLTVCRNAWVKVAGIWNWWLVFWNFKIRKMIKMYHDKRLCQNVTCEWTNHGRFVCTESLSHCKLVNFVHAVLFMLRLFSAESFRFNKVCCSWGGLLSVLDGMERSEYTNNY